MEIGSVLYSRYTVTARLGQGAMGQVYRAADAQTGQEVALKVIARDLAFDSEMLLRFRREGEALHQLRHPNIVGFIEMFAHEGQNIIVMEYVPGGNLHDLIKKGPLPPERARRIALEIGDALTRAHHIGIIHRDLKPENVLLTADGAPKLTDFGVARLVSEGTRLTGTGTQVGTPYYMSPEAWEGKPLDGQTDIWSLGVVFYEMLAGRLPFGGDTVIVVMNKVLNAPLPDLRSLRPEAPPGLARIVARMLCRDKAERYQTMREVAADIERGDIATPTPRPGPPAAPPAPDQTRLSPSAARAAAQAQPRPNRLRSLAWTLARLGLTALIGLSVMSCLILVGGAVVLGNILEGVVTSIPFFPNEIGPGATYVFSRPEVESQLNRQTDLTLPGTLRNLRLTFVPSDTLRANAEIFGADSTLILRAEVSNDLPRVSLVSFNGVPLPGVGDALVGGVNRGLAKVFTQNKLEMVSITFSNDDLTLVLNGPGVQRQARTSCSSNQSFRDEFGAVHGAWNMFETAEAKAYVEKGSFVLRAIAQRVILTQYLSGCSFGDAQITVDAVSPKPGSYIEYGLIFNRKDAQNYHAFLVATTGFYAFEQVMNGEHELWPAGWTPSPLIRTDGRVDQLGLRVDGLMATASLNGQALPEYDVRAGSYGNVGLVVSSGDNVDVRMDFDNFAVTILREATPFPTYAGPPNPTPPAAATARATPEPPGTLTPIQQGLTAGKCNVGDLCLIDYLGHQEPMGLTLVYGNLGGSFTWSPDGAWIAFAARPGKKTDDTQDYRGLYIIPRDHKVNDVVELYLNTQTSIQGLSWSPDGRWIAFVQDGRLIIIRPTAKDRQTLDATTISIKPAWSPDSQYVAWVAKGADGKSSQVWTIDLKSRNRKLLFVDAVAPKQAEKSLITWSPDGAEVVFSNEKGQAWSIKADCTPVPNRGCDAASRTEIKEVPAHWLSDFYPQWAGEEVNR